MDREEVVATSSAATSTLQKRRTPCPRSTLKTPDRTGQLTASERWRRRGVALLILFGLAGFAFVLHRHRPMGGWLVFHYLRAGTLAAVFALSSLVAGHSAIVRVLKCVLPLEEHVTVAFALGVVAFFLTSSLFGLLGLYGAPFFVLGPALLLALGARDFIRTAARLWRHAARLRRLSPSALESVFLAFGCVGILLVWFTILTPENASYDARWYHLPISEHYVAQGRITPFSEGWLPGASPQLASLLYAWAFSMPGALFDRVEMAAHMEFVIFLFTLVGISAIVRRVLRQRARGAWAALFLFPGIFCYDSGLVLGADHVAALFAAPIYLLCLRYWDAPTKRYAVLLGAAVAGALATKYTALILLPLPFVVVLARALRNRQNSWRETWSSAAVTAVSVLALTAPYWLKNAVFYGDPLFPLLRRWLPAHPWSQAAEAPYATWFTLRSPPFALWSVVEMFETLFTFSFVPHDFPQYHGDVPVFGSLFTLCTPLLIFVRGGRRLYWLFGGAYLGIGTWFFIHQFDRYLQALVPWMASATAVVLVLVWRAGGLARFSIALLVGLQVAWGAHVPFIPAHRAAGSSIQKVVVDLLGRDGSKRELLEPLTASPAWEAIGRALPRGAKVLIHEEQIHLGISAASALDYPGNQGAFYWGEPGASSPREVWNVLRAHGISHVVWASRLDHATDTLAGGLVFFEFATHHTRSLGTFGGFAVAELSALPPPDLPLGEVAYYPCDPEPPFASGLYPLAALARSAGDRRAVAAPTPGLSMQQAFERARFIVFDARCHGSLPSEIRSSFELIAARGQSMMLVRR